MAVVELTPAERSWLIDIGDIGSCGVIKGWSAEANMNHTLLSLLRRGLVTVETRYLLTDLGRAALNGRTP